MQNSECLSGDCRLLEGSRWIDDNSREDKLLTKPSKKNYKAIVDIAERLPEQTIQEDSNLLMYYDISLGRV